MMSGSKPRMDQRNRESKRAGEADAVQLRATGADEMSWTRKKSTDFKRCRGGP